MAAGALRGVVTREALIAALQEKGGATPVLDFMDAGCADGAGERLPRQRLRAAAARPGQRIVGVVDPQQRLVGYITAENLAELVMIQSSRSARAERAASV